MRKVLAHLVAEMRKLGATVVAADMTSIILATGKRNLTAAVGYADVYILFTASLCNTLDVRCPMYMQHAAIAV